MGSSSAALATPHDDSRPGVVSAATTAQPRREEPEFDPDDVGPPPPPVDRAQSDGEPEFDVSEDEPEEAQFPISHELLLKDHTKVVSALTMDPSGARVVSGSHDYDCKLWDFGGMDWRCKPFKTWEPAGSYYVRLLLAPLGRVAV